MASKNWLFGEFNPILSKTKLPRKVQVMKVFMYYHMHLKETINKSANIVTEKLMIIWNSAGIDTKAKSTIVFLIKDIHNDYVLLSKNKKRESDTQRKKLNLFKISLRMLFDVTPKNYVFKSVESERFLRDQRNGRKLKIKYSQWNNHHDNNKTVNADYFSECSSDEKYSDQQDTDFEITSSTTKSLMNQNLESTEKPYDLNNILYCSEVTSAVDRINISDNQYSILAGAIIAKVCKTKTVLKISKKEKFKVCRSTVRRRRIVNRKNTVARIKSEFHKTAKHGMVVHFDGKKMVDFTNPTSEQQDSQTERVAVALSGHNEGKILGVKKIARGTGKAIAESVYESLNEWNCTEKVIGMCFDTTSTNTGKLNGVCEYLQSKLMKINLLYFACRHHILELIIGIVFSSIFGASKSPNVDIFTAFRKKWRTIDKSKFDVLESSHFRSKLSKQFKAVTIQILLKALDKDKQYLPRNDYKELCQLTLIILGVRIPSYKFKRPGAHHHARWMSKVIYCLKMYLFRNQMDFSTETSNGLRDICLFVGLVYSRFWIQCPQASKAPFNDLNLYKDLHSFTSINKNISKCALDKLKNHLWYLSPELVPLSLFSNNVTLQEKKKLIDNMKFCEDADWTKREIKLTNTRNLHKKSLSDLVGPASLPALRSLRLSALDFMLNNDPKTWTTDEFVQSKNFVHSINVVNDLAERTIALMTNINMSITRNEDEKQNLLQVVEHHRKRVPKPTKKILLA